MDLHERFKELYHINDPNPKEYYAKCLITSLYTVGVVSNTPSPIPLPNWGDDADLLNIMKALSMLQTDIIEMIIEHRS